MTKPDDVVVYPADEENLHDLYSADCQCHPTVEVIGAAKGGSLPTLKIIREEIGVIKAAENNSSNEKFRLAYIQQRRIANHE